MDAPVYITQQSSHKFICFVMNFCLKYTVLVYITIHILT